MSQNVETQVLHAASIIDETKARAAPVYRSASYVFNDTEHASDLFALKQFGYIYTRLNNPTLDLLEKRIAALENGAAALAVASGTSGLHYTFLNICRAGDEIVSSSTIYGGTYTMLSAILPDQGINTNFVDIHDLAAVEAAITEKTRLLFTEVIGNPSLDVANIKALSELAHKHNLPLVVDSTFTTPALFRPLDHGADIVVHSLTKWIGGHGTALGGVVVDAGRFDWTDPKFALYNEPDPSYHGLRYAHDLGDLNSLAFILRLRLVPLRNLGAALSPDNAWIVLQGLETLPLRMERHSENALKVAQFLEGRAEVEWVRYPGLETHPHHADAKAQFGTKGFGGMVVFGIKGGAAAGSKFINALGLFSHVANVGDAKSLAIHPASTTHSQLNAEEQAAGGITPDLVRLSIGIEHIDDILADLEQAFAAAE
jgi:O-acetylhomoserine (thiol)-lyase